MKSDETHKKKTINQRKQAKTSLQKNIEKNLRESEERFRLLCEAAEEGIAIHDNGVIVEANQALARMFGYELPEMIGMYAERFSTKESWRIIKEHISTGDDKPYDVVGVRKDGSTFECLLVGKPCKYKDRIMRVATFSDITERKRMERILQSNEERLHGITTNLPGTVYQFYVTDDGEYGVNYVSERITKIFGLSPDNTEAMFPLFLSHVHEDDRDRFLSSIKSAVAACTNWDFEGRYVKSSGEKIWFHGLSTPTRHAGRLVFNGFLLNITERKQAEEKFYKIFMTTPDCVAITRLKDGLIIDVNKAYEDMVGWKREQVIGKTSTDPRHIFWADLSARDLMVADLQAGRYILNREFEFRRSDGSVHNGIYSARSINIDREECLIFILQDITVQKRAEEKFFKIFMTTPDCIGITRLKDGILIDVNKGCEVMLGWKRENVIGKKTTKPPLNFWVDPAARRLMVADLKAGRDVLHREIEFRRGDGSMRNGVYSARSINIDDEASLVFILQDVTERKQAEEQLRKSEGIFRVLFNQSGHFIGLMKPDGMLLQINTTAKTFAGMREEEFLEMPFWMAPWCSHSLDEQERLKKAIKRAAKGEFIRFETTHSDNAGVTRYVDLSISPVKNDNGVVILLIAEGLDITERKQAEDELKLFAENLEDANIALRVLMTSRDKDQKEFEDKLQDNINDLVIPYLKKLKMGNLDDRNKNYVSVLENNLNNILSPFMKDFRSSYRNLTPQEIQIVDLIRQGKNTKEIAQMLNASVNTIATHRNNLRKKLNLRNSKINLRSHILSYE
jgi:PAS domain S-box-containing protein